MKEINTTASIVENLKGRRGEEASKSTRGGPPGANRKSIEIDEQGWEYCMSGGKAVPVALMKASSPRSRKDEDQRAASWSTEETPWRWRARPEALAGQQRMVRLNVLGSSPQRRHSRESSALKQEA